MFCDRPLLHADVGSLQPFRVSRRSFVFAAAGVQLEKLEGCWKRFGDSAFKRWIFVFFNCMLLAVGVGVIGGCTSDMGVSVEPETLGGVASSGGADDGVDRGVSSGDASGDDAVSGNSAASGKGASPTPLSSTELSAGIEFVEPDEFLALAKAGKLPVIDVRTKVKFDMFEMPWSAVNIPLMQLTVRADEIPTTDGLLLVASNDDESLRVADVLADLGISVECICTLSGGTDQWIADKRPYTLNPSLIAC